MTNKIAMTILEMKNAGQKQQEWSDDDRKWKFSGPQYIRIVARMSDDGAIFYSDGDSCNRS